MKRPYNHPDNIGSDGQPKMSEDAWAIYEQLREDMAEDSTWGNDLAVGLESRASKADFAAALEAAVASHHRETVELMSNLASRVDDVATLVTAVNTLASKIDSLKTAVLAGFAKADADAGVADTNYAATVSALLT